MLARSFPFVVGLALLALPMCSKYTTGGEAPVASLGFSLQAERAFRPLLRRWMLATHDARRVMDPELSALVRQYPQDPLAVLANVLRGWDALQRGDRDSAVKLVEPARVGPPGTARDLATLVVGAAARRAARPREALALLMPLLHKLLDPSATVLLDEELVRAAAQAGRWQQALQLMDVWLFESEPGDYAAVISKIAAMLGDCPRAELLADARRRRTQLAHTTNEGRRLAEAIAQHLAREVVAAHDVALARILLSEFGPVLGNEGEEVARLAADLVRARVAAKTVGVLLALGSSAFERRSADVVAGMSFGIGIGDSDARLVARDDGGSPDNVTRALIELAAEGAAVIVAGVDPRHAEQAARFAARQGLPLLLLTGDHGDLRRRDPSVFVLGPDVATSVGALAVSLRERGAKVVAGLGAPIAEERDESRLGVGVRGDCTPPPARDSLVAERVDAIVALDGAYCGAAVVDLAAQLGAPLAVGLGAAVGIDLPEGSRIAAAGIFPLASDPLGLEPRLQSWLDSGRPRPSWWAALGRDAAVLAATAVRDLGDAATEVEVRTRRVQAAAALAGATHDLWTSDAKGFDADRRLPRTIRILQGRGRRAQP